jgi:hypothetical protein
MYRALAALSVVAGALALPVQAAPRPATIGSAATVDFRVVLTARRTSAGDAPTAAVTATIYRLGRDSWERTGSRKLPGTYFWNVVSRRNAVCGLSIATAGAAAPQATVRLLVSPSIGCGRAYRLALS